MMTEVASGSKICNELSEEGWGPIVALGVYWHHLYGGQFVSICQSYKCMYIPRLGIIAQ